ncbi:hypothetical protein [Actinokineospora inagensis]|uniref:hypothetical protein n=1 Tax=Actinokineospora inagensis TaxID=103730 RepID=UPI00041B1DF3|nr:hypothetical protein [Actinokineospora inagensis]
MTTPEIVICQVCEHALEHYADNDGASYRHTRANGPTDHDPVPVPAPPGWRGQCDFCAEGRPEFVIPVRDFAVMTLPEKDADHTYTSMADWAACSVCALLVESNRWNILLSRAMAARKRRTGESVPDEVLIGMGKIYRLLRDNITGAAKPIDSDEGAS